jgi:endonuclease/exonuclease/phosphatase (EEP) superfamily protein YafD
MTALRFCLATALLGVLAVSLAGFLPVWPGDMITPFRMHLAYLAVAGCWAGYFLNRRWLTRLAMMTAIICILPMGVRLLALRPFLPPTAPTAQPLSLVFSNVLCDSHHYDRVVAMARHENADLFAAAETTPVWIDHLDSLSDIYPYHVAPRDLGVFGVALYAKRPFTAQVFKTGSRGMVLLRADFGGYIVYVAHPMPPANPVLTEDNRVYLESLAARVAVETKPVIIAGDFNATIWAHNLKPLIRQKLQWPNGSGFAYSWPVGRPWLRIQIDQVLTRGAIAGRYRTLPNVGSDHYPIRVDLAMPPA